MPDPVACPMLDPLTFKNPKGRTMPASSKYSLCLTPWHTYGTYGAPLGIPMEPAPHQVVEFTETILGQFMIPHLSVQIKDYNFKKH